mgnify:CR=1 FL=1
MRPGPKLFLTLLFMLSMQLSAQEAVPAGDLLDSDIDALFEEEAQESEQEPEKDKDAAETEPSVLTQTLKRRGVTFGADYKFVAGYLPGWSEVPWIWKSRDESFSQILAADMGSLLLLDFQLSPSLRIKHTLSFAFPEFVPETKEFYCDYTLNDLAFFRIGKHAVPWGVSPNYAFANLPARIPAGNSGGDPYAVKADIPVGIGGLQLLALTRSGFIADQENPSVEVLGYGFKYNLALPLADVNIGSFYHREMPARGSMSLEVTLFGRTEMYAEGLVAFDQNTPEEPVFAASLGLYDSFLNDRLKLNGEYFYNGEDYSFTVDDIASIVDTEESSPYPLGHNMTMNISYRPRSSVVRLFARVQYNATENSGQVIPGCSVDLQHGLSVYLTGTMAVGSETGSYYRNNFDTYNRPFGLALAATISGSYRKTFSY